MKQFKNIAIMVSMISILFVAVSSAAAKPSNDVKEVVGRLLADGKVKQASAKIEEYLKKYPNHIDVLMMKGNVVLREQSSKIMVLPVNSESIYDPTAGSITPEIIPREVAVKVAGYWNKCLKMDPNRDDILNGLCYLYAQALMKNELIELLPRLKSALRKDKNVAGVMEQYALMLSDRNQYVMCMDVYRAIMKLFPEEASLYSNMASLYCNSNRWSDARKNIGIALQKRHKDPSVYNNAFYIYVVSGYYARALATWTSLNELDHSNKYLFFKALYQYYQDKAEWRQTMKLYLKKADKRKEKLERDFGKFLVSRSNKDDYKSYVKSLKKLAEVDYSLLVHRRAMKKFGTKFLPYYNYGKCLSFLKNYQEANLVFQKAEAKRLAGSSEEKENLDLHYGWSLQASRKTQTANTHWVKLLNSKDFYNKSAACYFYGKNLLTGGKRAEGIKYLKMIAGDGKKSKYEVLSDYQLKRLTGKK
jgi:hypothetical protein